jgi:thiol:disulfide interchange protein DsbD
MSTKTEKTLLLTRDDVARLLTLPDLIEALREAYCLRANHELVIRPQRAMAKYGEESTTVIFPGVLPDCERYTVKVNAKTAGNVARGLPFLRGVILLINRADGSNEAILESGLLTAMRTGAAGAVAKGVITTLLGASCSAPVVAVAFAFALDRDTPAWATIGTFAVIGVGMASPYLILGAFPRLLRFLPKPGAWMDTFKHICGFVMLAAMVWVLTWLRMPYVAPTVAFLVGLWFACWWVGRVPLTEPRPRRIRAWLESAAFSIAAGWLAFSVVAPAMEEKFQLIISEELGRRDHSQDQATGPRPVSVLQSSHPAEPPVVDGRIAWKPFSKALLTQLTREHRTVIVDFTADWCANCKTLEKLVLDTDAVKDVLQRNGVVPLVADYTDAPAELTSMLTILKAGAVPVLAIFPAGNPNRPTVFRGGYTQQTLIKELEKAGPSRSIARVKDTAMQ